MRSATRLLTLLLAVLLLLCGCTQTPDETQAELTNGTIYGSTDPEESEPEEIEDEEPGYYFDFTSKSIFELSNAYDYIPKAGVSNASDAGAFYTGAYGDYSVAQGAACDGKYGYFAQSGQSNSSCGAIIKVDLSTWEVVKAEQDLPIEHCNSMTWNEKLGKLVVAHCKPSTKRISIVDPETLQVEKSFDLDVTVKSISYSAGRDMYVVRHDGFGFTLLDADFKVVAQYEGVDSQLGNQNIFVDDNYIYRLDSGVSAKPGYEAVVIYDWDGNYLGAFRVDSLTETESLFYYDGSFYVTFFQAATTVCKLDMDLSLLG